MLSSGKSKCPLSGALETMGEEVQNGMVPEQARWDGPSHERHSRDAAMGSGETFVAGYRIYLEETYGIQHRHPEVAEG